MRRGRNIPALCSANLAPTLSECFKNLSVQFWTQVVCTKTVSVWVAEETRTHLVGGKGFAGKVLGTGVEAFLDEARVETHKVLHLLLLDDLGHVCLLGAVEL